jgi:hypothetical protein
MFFSIAVETHPSTPLSQARPFDHEATPLNAESYTNAPWCCSVLALRSQQAVNALLPKGFDINEYILRASEAAKPQCALNVIYRWTFYHVVRWSVIYR